MSQNTPETFELEIDKLVTGGAGLGRHEGQAVFVHGSAPGDRVRVNVQQQKKGFIAANLVEVLSPGPDRREPPCPHFGECGGCDLQHLTPAAQRQAKADILVDCFQRLGKLDITDRATGPEAIGTDLHYRNKIRMFGSPTGLYGLVRRGTHEVVPIETCPLLPEQFDTTILPWLRTLPPVEQIVIHFDDRGNWLISVFGPPKRARVLKKMLAEIPESEPPAANCTGVLYNNLPLWGHDYLVIRLAEKKYRVSARSFFQGNLAVTETAVATVRNWVQEIRRPGGLLADLFCGVGLFSLALADLFAETIAIDEDPQAIRDLINNVKRDPGTQDKTTIFKGSVARVLKQAKVTDRKGWQDACCVLDPPRAGLGKDGLNSLLKLAPRHIIYMSCDPATLARDTAALRSAGYSLDRISALDMFPQTAHLETLLQMTRSD